MVEEQVVVGNVDSEKEAGITVEHKEAILEVTIYGVRKSVFDEFALWCRMHCNGKYQLGLKRLLEIAKESNSSKLNELESRIAALEQKVEKPKEEAKVLKTFGNKG